MDHGIPALPCGLMQINESLTLRANLSDGAVADGSAKWKTFMKIAKASALIAALLALFVMANSRASACTRVVYLGKNGDVITARSMDWKTDIGTNLWIFPRGMMRSGEAGPNSIKWTSQYGSVIATGYEVSTADGVNEAGLVANLLWLAESEYPKSNAAKPGLSIAAWAQ
jgi:penicillin V acylase-like amidase (Ntn superfamily)